MARLKSSDQKCRYCPNRLPGRLPKKDASDACMECQVTFYRIQKLHESLDESRAKPPPAYRKIIDQRINTYAERASRGHAVFTEKESSDDR